jgi:UDP:flavonoid glycosyltransferase YjiC (YdhE family)
MAQFLLAAMPCVLAPLHPEQRLFAEAVGAFGAGVIVDYSNEKQLLAGVRQVLSDKRYRDAAASFAARHAADDQGALDARMHNEIERLITTSVSRP